MTRTLRICDNCEHADPRVFAFCPNCGTINRIAIAAGHVTIGHRDKNTLISETLRSDKGRSQLAKAMTEPYRV